MDLRCQGRILRRKAERIPPHGIQNVVSLHPTHPGDHVPDRIVPHVPHVDPTRWIGKHLEDIILRPALDPLRHEQTVAPPRRLPSRFDILRVVEPFANLFTCLPILRLRRPICLRHHLDPPNLGTITTLTSLARPAPLTSAVRSDRHIHVDRSGL